MTDCSVCVEKFTSVKRKKITCNKCNYEICSVCAKRYLKSLNDDPQCMNCGCGFSLEFLCDNMTSSFYTKDILDNKTRLFQDIEKGKLQQTAENMKEEKDRQDKIDEIMEK